MEQVDVVVVGGRLAGCAAAPPLARAGRRVVVLDRMRFPSDQLSTHLLMPAGTSELAKLGATAERQENSLNALAVSAGTSGGQIIDAIQDASDFTIDKMGAMEQSLWYPSEK